MPLINLILRSLKSISATLAHNLFAVVVAGLIGVPVLISWVTGTLNSLFQLLQSPVQLWAALSLALLILSLCIIPALAVNRKNKSLQKKLESCLESLENQSNIPEPEARHDKETLTFTSNESPKIVSGIKIQSTFKQSGWYCISEDLVCMKHNRTLHPDNYASPYEYCCREHGCKIKIKAPLTSFAKSEARDLTESHIRKTLNIEPKETDRLP